MRDFLATAEDRLNKIKSECKTAVNDFGDCVEFYGEERQQTSTTTFFSSILKFVRSYKTAEGENEQKKRVSMKAQSPPEPVKVTGKKQQVRIRPSLSHVECGPIPNSNHAITVCIALVQFVPGCSHKRVEASSSFRKQQKVTRNLSRGTGGHPVRFEE